MSVAVNKKNLFEKGNTASKGRPKGSYSPLRKQLMELRKKAAENASEAFDDLWVDFKAGDPLAKQIYFKELVSVPKEWLNEVSITGILTEIKSIDDVSTVLAALVNTLLNVDSISTDEVLNIVKTLNAIKLTEQFGKQNKAVETAEEYEARMQDIKLFTQWKRERNQNIDS